MILEKPLYYKGPVTYVWSYAIYLGPFTNSQGKNYDLGIVLDDVEGKLACIVYGNESSNYKSGELTPEMADKNEAYAETRRRAISLQLI